MLETTEIRQIMREPEAYIGKRVELAGWIRNIRVSKQFGFIELNDGSFFQNLQIVFENKLDNFGRTINSFGPLVNELVH